LHSQVVQKAAALMKHKPAVAAAEPSTGV
jgi:hypothetical protein